MSEPSGELPGDGDAPKPPEGMSPDVFMSLSAWFVEYKSVLDIAVAAGFTEAQALRLIADLIHRRVYG